jgi:hypothetical protein
VAVFMTGIVPTEPGHGLSARRHNGWKRLDPDQTNVWAGPSVERVRQG